MDWNKYRRPNGTIDLLLAYMSENDRLPKRVESYIKLVEAYQPIRSRQVAAVIMAHADELAVI